MSRVISDSWTAYSYIEHINDGIYTHNIILHKDDYVDPFDRSIHTQNREHVNACRAQMEEAIRCL